LSVTRLIQSQQTAESDLSRVTAAVAGQVSAGAEESGTLESINDTGYRAGDDQDQPDGSCKWAH